MGDGDDYLLMSILKHSITSWRVRSFFPGCHLYKLEDNGSTGLHRGYKLLQIEQANMLHPCSAALIKTIKRSDRRGRKPTSRWFNCALLRQHLHSSQVSQHGLVALVRATPKADPQRVQWGWGHSFIPTQILWVSEKPNLSASTAANDDLPSLSSKGHATPPPSHCLHQRMLLNQHQSVSTACHMGLMLKARDWPHAGCSSGCNLANLTLTCSIQMGNIQKGKQLSNDMTFTAKV